MELVPLVKHFEGLHRIVRRQPAISVAPYLCPAGYWTIGYGHLCRPEQEEIDEALAEQLLHVDLDVARKQVFRLAPVPMSGHQLDALSSFVFNLGASRFRGSTLRAHLLRNEFEEVPNQLRRWVFAGGRRLPGLVARREAEVDLWLGIT
jgi:lysozyme